MTQTRIAPGVGALSEPGPILSPLAYTDALRRLSWNGAHFCRRLSRTPAFARQCRERGVEDPRVARWLRAVLRLHDLLPGPIDEAFEDDSAPRFAGEAVLRAISSLGWTPHAFLVRAGVGMVSRSREDAIRKGKPLPLPVDRWLGRLYDADRQLTLDCPDIDAVLRRIHVEGSPWSPPDEPTYHVRRRGREISEIEAAALQALQRLVALEPDPETIDSLEAYAAYRAPYAEEIAACEAQIRTYGGLFRTTSPAAMRKAGQRLTAKLEGPSSVLVQGAAKAALDRAWDGIGGWRK